MANLYTKIKAVAAGLMLVLPVAASAQDSPTFSFEVSDIQVNDASVIITPSDTEMTYIWDITPKDYFERDGGVDKVVENSIARWKRSAANYPNTDWTEMMSYAQVKGEQVIYSLNEYITLFSGTEYVVYAFGMDAAGTQTAPVQYTLLTTEDVAKSDNTFAIKLKSVYADGYRMAAKAEVTPSNSDFYTLECVPKSVYDKADMTPGSVGEKSFVAFEIAYYGKDENRVSGEHEFTFTGLTEGTEYVLVAVGLDEAWLPTTSVTPLPFKCEPTASPTPQATIEIKVSDITPMNAHLVITPSDPELTYYYEISTAESVERHGGIDKIPEELCIAWWKYIADLYSGQYSWQDIMKTQLSTGNIDATISELTEAELVSNVFYNTEYVAYAVAFDADGNVVSNIATATFRTPMPEQSDLTFDVELTGAEPDPDYTWSKRDVFVADITVYPSNPTEEYMAAVMKTDILDQYDRESEADMFEFITYQFYRKSVVFNDAVTLRCPGLYATSIDGSICEYYLIAMGWNEGPTTPVTAYKFTYDNFTGVSLVKTDDVLVVPGQGCISVTGTTAAVFSTSGAFVGSVRSGTSLGVPAGVYLVHYMQNGAPVTRKVVVR